MRRNWSRIFAIAMGIPPIAGYSGCLWFWNHDNWWYYPYRGTTTLAGGLLKK